LHDATVQTADTAETKAIVFDIARVMETHERNASGSGPQGAEATGRRS
jgi:hypothetical protein